MSLPCTTPEMHKYCKEIISSGDRKERLAEGLWFTLQPEQADPAVSHCHLVGFTASSRRQEQLIAMGIWERDTHLRSEPGFLFLLPQGRQKRKGYLRTASSHCARKYKTGREPSSSRCHAQILPTFIEPNTANQHWSEQPGFRVHQHRDQRFLGAPWLHGG